MKFRVSSPAENQKWAMKKTLWELSLGTAHAPNICARAPLPRAIVTWPGHMTRVKCQEGTRQGGSGVNEMARAHIHKQRYLGPIYKSTCSRGLARKICGDFIRVAPLK